MKKKKINIWVTITIFFGLSFTFISTMALPVQGLIESSFDSVEEYPTEKLVEPDLVSEEIVESKSESIELEEINNVETMHNFSFSQIRIKKKVNEIFTLTFSSETEVKEVVLQLPNEANIVNENLSKGLSFKKMDLENYWFLSSENYQVNFSIPLVFEKEGRYEVSIGEEKMSVEIENEKDVPGSAACVNNLVSSISLNELNQEAFQGNIAEVSTMEDFKSAVENPLISTISVNANLTDSIKNVMLVNRPLLIKGNGNILNFNESYFQLEEVNESTAFQIENATIIKKGLTPLVNSTAVISSTWSLELENITELYTTMRLAALPEGKVIFTGGNSNFTSKDSSQNFIEAKEISAINQAQVTINRGNASIFFSDATVSSPKLTIENGSTISITTTGGNSNTIDFKGENPKIVIQSNGKLEVESEGSRENPTNITNNTVALTGSSPQVTVEEDGQLYITSTLAKRGLYLSGNNSEIIVSDSIFEVTSEMQSAINLKGESSQFLLKDSSSKITSTTGVSIELIGPNSNLSYENSTTTITSTAGQRVQLIGDNPTVTLANTKLTLNSTNGDGVYFQGTKPRFIVEGSTLDISNTGDAKGVVMDGDDALLSLNNKSEFNIVNEGFGNNENIQIGSNNSHPQLVLAGGSTLSVTTESGINEASETKNNAIHLKGSEPSLALSEDSEVCVLVKSNSRRGIYLNGENAQLTVIGSKLNIDTISGQGLNLTGDSSKMNFHTGSNGNLHSKNSNALFIGGKNANVSIKGLETKLLASSEINKSEGAGTFVLVTPPNVESAGSLEIDDASIFEVYSKDSPAINITSLGFNLNISNAQLKVENSNANDDNATVRFLYYGLTTFNVKNNGVLNVTKKGGNAPLIRIPSGGNSFEVSNGGKVELYNPGNGIANDGNIAGGNQGIYYARGINTNGLENNFSLVGVNSKFISVSDNGPGIVMDPFFKSQINVEQGYFEVKGKTSTSNGGIFRGGNLSVTFNNPLFLNFQNNRAGGGNIFSVTDDSRLKATNSDLSLWKNGSNLDGDPDLNFETLDFIFTGINFNTLEFTNKPNILNTQTFGKNGLTAYSALTSNNARWAIADELRVPTNADKKIHGRVSVPEGLGDTRPTWDNEAIVTIEVEKKDGEKQKYTTKTVGHTNESPGISIYGENPRGGLFEIELEEPLEAGTKVRISNVRLSSGELTEGFENKILTDTVEVFPIIPPSPAQFISSAIVENSKIIQGYSENKKSKVTVMHNGEFLNTENVEVANDGNFTIHLDDVDLEEGDEIQVFLRDNEGSAESAGVINPPKTNNNHGNVNPVTDFYFHDAVFKAATILTVIGLDPVSPLDPLNPEIEIDPENKPNLPEKQGALSIDYISQLNFGKQTISVKNKIYYAQPQRILNEDGTVNIEEERPNYVQISDRRAEKEHMGWQLSVTQNEQFMSLNKKELTGAQVKLMNQQLTNSNGNTENSIQMIKYLELLPGVKSNLLLANGKEGIGTWIYRFGDSSTAKNSVALEVPSGTNPDATSYSTTFTWELSAVPPN